VPTGCLGLAVPQCGLAAGRERAAARALPRWRARTGEDATRWRGGVAHEQLSRRRRPRVSSLRRWRWRPHGTSVGAAAGTRVGGWARARLWASSGPRLPTGATAQEPQVEIRPCLSPHSPLAHLSSLVDVVDRCLLDLGGPLSGMDWCLRFEP
jgi:hypothetical protein